MNSGESDSALAVFKKVVIISTDATLINQAKSYIKNIRK
jgi:hypothetical protein